jgi:DNA-binding MarR family transcriptional regulator
MRKAAHNGKQNMTLLERVLQLNGVFRRRLEPLGTTPLQAGMILYLQRHPGAKVKATATALAIQPPTVSPMVRSLVRKGWVTNSRSASDDRTVCLRLTRHGQGLARKIMGRLRDMKSDLTLKKDAR